MQVIQVLLQKLSPKSYLYCKVLLFLERCKQLILCRHNCRLNCLAYLQHQKDTWYPEQAHDLRNLQQHEFQDWNYLHNNASYHHYKDHNLHTPSMDKLRICYQFLSLLRLLQLLLLLQIFHVP